MTNLREKSRVYTLVVLVVFLTFSSWFVSFLGTIWISLGRDALLFIFLLLSVFDFKNFRKPNLVTWLILALILLTSISYFFKQDSLSQYLRGARYLVEPFILLLSLHAYPLKPGSVKTLSRALIFSLIVVIIGAFIDFFVPMVIRYTLHHGVVGYLGQINLAGGDVRLQSLLAGPNALGLFLMVGILLSPVWSKFTNRYLTVVIIILSLIALTLTYSRSSYIGLIFGLVMFFGLTSKYIKHSRLLATALITLSLFVVVAVILFQPSDLIRTQSNNDRLAQYQRVWQERDQIGLFGRGAGTAGLVSEYAFDGSTNYHSENSYLDVSENIGWLGGLVYLAVWLTLIIQFAKRPDVRDKALSATLIGLAIAGLFIDHYTGQIAIWLVMLFVGTMFYQNEQNSPVEK